MLAHQWDKKGISSSRKKIANVISHGTTEKVFEPKLRDQQQQMLEKTDNIQNIQ